MGLTPLACSSCSSSVRHAPDLCCRVKASYTQLPEESTSHLLRQSIEPCFCSCAVITVVICSTFWKTVIFPLARLLDDDDHDALQSLVDNVESRNEEPINCVASELYSTLHCQTNIHEEDRRCTSSQKAYGNTSHSNTEANSCPKPNQAFCSNDSAGAL